MDWHNGADNYPKELSAEAAGTHIGMYLAWIINNDLYGSIHNESQDQIEKVKNRKISGADFLIEQCDEKLWNDDFNEVGKEFTEHYYLADTFFSDYEKALCIDEPTLYHIKNSWENYDKLSIYIDIAYKNWLKNK
jgi:hypothetical protein